MKSEEFAAARNRGQCYCPLTSLTSLTSITPKIIKKMKKTYIIPEMLTVKLGTMQMMAQSTTAPTVGVNSSATAVDGADLDVKESKNLWDEEW